MTEHREEYVTPEGLVRECIDPDLRRITREVLDHREADRAAIEAEGFVLAYERPL